MLYNPRSVRSNPVIVLISIAFNLAPAAAIAASLLMPADRLLATKADLTFAR